MLSMKKVAIIGCCFLTSMHLESMSFPSKKRAGEELNTPDTKRISRSAYSNMQKKLIELCFDSEDVTFDEIKKILDQISDVYICFRKKGSQWTYYPQSEWFHSAREQGHPANPGAISFLARLCIENKHSLIAFFFTL